MRRVAGQGQGALLTLAIPCPGGSGRRGWVAATSARAAIWDAVKGGWVTLPEVGDGRKGFPMLGGMVPLGSQQGLLFPGTFYAAGPGRGTLHTRTLQSQKQKVQHPFGR